MEYCVPNGWLLSAFVLLVFILGALVGAALMWVYEVLELWNH